MDVSYAINELSTAMHDMADFVDRMAPRRPVLEEKLLKLVRGARYIWKWHPGSGRVTATLSAGYRVTLTPSKDATVVAITKRQPKDPRGLTEATFPELYVSLDIWYQAYNRAVQDDGLTLDDVLSGRMEVEGPITEADISNLIESGLVREEAKVPLAAKADHLIAAEERKANSAQTEDNTDVIEGIRVTPCQCQNAYEAGDCGDEG